MSLRGDDVDVVALCALLAMTDALTDSQLSRCQVGYQWGRISGVARLFVSEGLGSESGAARRGTGNGWRMWTAARCGGG